MPDARLHISQSGLAKSPCRGFATRNLTGAGSPPPVFFWIGSLLRSGLDFRDIRWQWLPSEYNGDDRYLESSDDEFFCRHHETPPPNDRGYHRVEGRCDCQRRKCLAARRG